MALQTRSRRRRRMAEINIVPYIDVMLVLLIIFMVTAPMLNLGADIQLPQSGAKALQDEKQPVLVTVDHDGNVFLTLGKSPREQVDDETLVKDVSAFVKQDPKASVMLGGDKRVDAAGRRRQGRIDEPARGCGGPREQWKALTPHRARSPIPRCCTSASSRSWRWRR